MKSKILLSVISLGLIASVVSGCSFAGLTKKTEPVELTVWAAAEDMDMVKGWCESFASMYPEEEFSFRFGVEDECTAKDTVLTDLDEAADVYSFAGDQFQDLVSGEALNPVTIDTEKIIDAAGGSGSAIVKAASKAGALYAYPATADNGYFMFYNKKYFDEEDVKSLDKMLSKAAECGKLVTMQYDSGWYNLSFFLGAGFEISSKSDGSTVCNFNGTSATGIKGTDVAKAMLDIQANSGFLSMTDDEFIDGVKDGSVIAGINGTWNAENVSNAWKEDYAATHLPTYTCNGKQIQMGSVEGYKMFGVNPKSDNVEWAMRLAEYFTDYDQQIERFRKRGAGPSNVKAATSQEVLDNPAIAALASQAQYSVPDGCEGVNYWTAAETFGYIMAAGNPDETDLQTLLDSFVESAAKPAK